MPVQKLTTKKATARTPQVVTLVVDDSGSMSAVPTGGRAKNVQAQEATQSLVTTMQSWNQNSSGSRYILNIAKFGSSTVPIAEAATPENVILQKLVFEADSGGTEMPEALAWASQALQKALAECKKVPGYAEEACPNPLVLFFSDGENTGGDVASVAKALKGIPFSGGAVDVVAVGIGMDQKDFPVMEVIASRPDLAVNIDPNELAEFIAEVGQTLQKSGKPEEFLEKFDK